MTLAPRWLALGGIAGPVLMTTVVILCAALRPDYSHLQQFISELGARGTPNAALMNAAGFVATGASLALFAFSLGSLLPPRRSSRASAALLFVFATGTVVSGLVPCEPGCPQDAMTLHDAVAVVAFLSAIAAVALAARVFRTHPAWRNLWLYSALSAAAALGFLATMFLSIEARELTGLWQRLLVGTLLLWCAVVALRAFPTAHLPSR